MTWTRVALPDVGPRPIRLMSRLQHPVGQDTYLLEAAADVAARVFRRTVVAIQAGTRGAAPGPREPDRGVDVRGAGAGVEVSDDDRGLAVRRAASNPATAGRCDARRGGAAVLGGGGVAGPVAVQRGVGLGDDGADRVVDHDGQQHALLA